MIAYLKSDTERPVYSYDCGFAGVAVFIRRLSDKRYQMQRLDTEPR